MGAYRLRRLHPNRVADAAFVVGLRRTVGRDRWINPTPESVARQQEWVALRAARPDDHYFLVERQADGRLEGTVSLYDVTPGQEPVAEWGRWVLRPDSLAAAESVLLVLRFGFEGLGLQAAVTRTLAGNGQVVAFHDRLGAARAPGAVAVALAGVEHAAVEHRYARAVWPELEQRLMDSAERVVRLLAARSPAPTG